MRARVHYWNPALANAGRYGLLRPDRASDIAPSAVTCDADCDTTAQQVRERPLADSKHLFSLMCHTGLDATRLTSALSAARAIPPSPGSRSRRSGAALARAAPGQGPADDVRASPKHGLVQVTDTLQH